MSVASSQWLTCIVMVVVVFMACFVQVRILTRFFQFPISIIVQVSMRGLRSRCEALMLQ